MWMYDYDHDSYMLKISPDKFHVETENYPYEPMPYRIVLKMVDRIIGEMCDLYRWDQESLMVIQKLQHNEPLPSWAHFTADDIEGLEELLASNARNVKRHHKQLNLVAKYLRFCPFV